MLAVLSSRAGRPSLPRLFVILLVLAMALVSRRNISIFGLVAFPLLALEIDADWRRLPSSLLAKARHFLARLDGERMTMRWAPGLGILLVPLALGHGSVAGERIIADRFSETRFPVAAARFATANAIEGRLFTEMTWGGWVLHDWEGQRIFIDGMTDFFGESLLRDYVGIMSLMPGWDDRLDSFGISLVLVVPDRPLAYALRREAGWRVLFEDETAVLLGRRQAPTNAEPPTSTTRDPSS
jgi:hypothetical protein